MKIPGSQTKRSRLLFLAWYFPPAHSIGCVRAWNTAKYLARLGWDVTVVTPDPAIRKRVERDERIGIRTEEEGIQRILTGHEWRCLRPNQLRWRNHGLGWFAGAICRKVARRLGIDSAVGWVSAAEEACSTLTDADVDVILASGPPFAPFRLAKRLCERLGRPYVLDYRDPWTRKPHSARPARSGTIREEERLLAECSAVTITSYAWAQALDDRFGIGPKLHVIPNGFDPEELICVEPFPFDHFAIVYTGTFYPPKRVISSVMAALKRLKEMGTGRGDRWRFHYYGRQESYVREEARRFGVMDRVVFHGLVPRAEALSAIRGAGATVVITSVLEEGSLEDKGIVTGKVFEPLGLGSPILLIAPPGSDVEALVGTTGGAGIYTGSDIEGIASFLKELMSGRTPERRQAEAYMWPNIVKELDTVLQQAMSSAGTACAYGNGHANVLPATVSEKGVA